jgi:uncharacterized protein (TIGR02246 family)
VTDTDPLAVLPDSDRAEIATTLGDLLGGFAERDADRLLGVYSPDAHWVNAFGTVQRGGPAIVEYLRSLFADDNFNAGTLKAPPEIGMRVLTADVVLVTAHLQVDGQKLVGGGELPERDNFSLRVLKRQLDGRWLIEAEMFNDANRDATYKGN